RKCYDCIDPTRARASFSRNSLRFGRDLSRWKWSPQPNQLSRLLIVGEESLPVGNSVLSPFVERGADRTAGWRFTRLESESVLSNLLRTGILTRWVSTKSTPSAVSARSELSERVI